jgi:hypothetical protein|eukprot:COSAG01_NODE_1246_length_11073_cov_38.365683_3_plen_171_part_00
MSAESSDLRFPVHRGFYLFHTQLMVLVAMVYRGFKMRHPWYLSVSLVVINSISVGLILLFKPNDHVSLNKVRLAVAGLSAMWSLCGLIAQIVDDKSSYASAIVLLIGQSIWVGCVAFVAMRGSTDDRSDEGSGETNVAQQESADSELAEAENPVAVDTAQAVTSGNEADT